MIIDGNTRIVGILANPISHVRTPQLFNASAAKQGLNAVCIPCHVLNEDMKAFLACAAAIQNYLGMAVTIPYKERALEACGELTESAREAGSVNAMRYDRDKHLWIGGNFDGTGFVAGLRERGHSVRGKRVLLLGAGGAAKPIAYAIAREQPATLVIHNRSEDRAVELAACVQRGTASVGVQAGPADASDFDVVINATSLGLRDSDPLPLPAETLRPGTLVCEAVIRDGDTPLLAEARKHSCEVHHGQYMLYAQIVAIARFVGVELESTFVERILGPHDS
ncbi:shikimate dehydrogenase [Paraburkholderia sp. BL27I4N3]|uniref:shikimate dehydrogenase family protein n=1 Tax=Paraburkholderia sp. BL27I4N3 TaxID=1938805 RepID=UPI000E25DFBA|nr:shikimate dehydrogenase [Paraburkholderia sp. BL27I4N3]REE07120.1 shikimate dehydrogenase [Paraburkholderia sp. BL27I4N3]